MPDQELVCRDCGETFAFTEAEQSHFRAQGFTHPPKRCRACRARARQRAPSGGNGRRGPVDGASADPTATAAADPVLRPVVPSTPRAPKPRGPMHPAVCSLCATETEVPFVPDGVRPVFCLPCLKKQTR